MTVVPGITLDMAPAAAAGRAGVTVLVPGTMTVRITARVCAWVVDRIVSSTGNSIVTDRAGRVTAAVARDMRQVFRMMRRKTRVNTRAIRVVAQVTAVAVRVMHRVLRVVHRVIRVNTRATRVVVRVTAVAVRVMRQVLRAVNQVARVNTRATRRVVRAMAAADRVVHRTIVRAGASEPPGAWNNPNPAGVTTPHSGDSDERNLHDTAGCKCR
jgi:hypothetical protein